jgi:hypothetical protein
MTWPQYSASRLLLNRVNRVHIHTPYTWSLPLTLFFHPNLVLSRRPILLDSQIKRLQKNVKKSRFFKQRPYGNLGVRGTAQSILEFNQCPNEDVCTSKNTRTNKISKTTQKDKLYGNMDTVTYTSLLARVTEFFSSYVQIINVDTCKQMQPLAQLNSNWKPRILSNCNWQAIEWWKIVYQFFNSKRVVNIHLGYSSLKINVNFKTVKYLITNIAGPKD